MSPAPGDFSGRVALVTGAGSGIGAAVAVMLAARGARLALAGRRADALDAVAGRIRSAGGIAWTCPTDVTDEAAVARLVDGAATRFDALHFAVNCAGAGIIGDIEHTDARAFEQVMRANATGTYISMRAELSAIERTGEGGAIVNVTSILGQRGAPGFAAYAASKHAIVGMTRCAALEYGGRGIRINAIAPGPTETDMLAELPDDLRAGLVAGCAMQRVATPDEIARGIVYLLGEAGYVTGIVLTADGGTPCG